MLSNKYYCLTKFVVNRTQWHVRRCESTNSPLHRLFEKINQSDPLPQYRNVVNRTQWHVRRCESTNSRLHKLFEKINRSDPLPQYRNVKELKTASLKVQKALSMEYATIPECISYLTCKFIEEINPSKACYDKVHEIVKLHLSIKYVQAKFKPEYQNSHFVGQRISSNKKKRSSLLDELRDHQFETYVKVMTVLDMQHYFKSQFKVEGTEIADEVEDMRIRSFAEARRLDALKEERKSKLLSLTDKYAQEISTGDVVS